MSSPTPLVWLITGTSTGIGRQLALTALARGDRVIATARARSLHTLSDLVDRGAEALELDVTSPPEALRAVAEKAEDIWGGVDVLVNNAGSYLAPGALEEITPEETLAEFNVHVFGAMNVARAFSPRMRARKTGTIIWIGSVVGWQGGASFGVYSATKHAVRGLAESLDIELAPFNVRSVCVEPGFFKSDIGSPHHRTVYENRIPEYKEVVTKVDDFLYEMNRSPPGDTVKLAALVVDAAHEPRTLPFALPIGAMRHALVKARCEEMLGVLETWEERICATDVEGNAEVDAPVPAT